MPLRSLENQIVIYASATTVERCITDLSLMSQWLNPMLICEPDEDHWSTDIGSKSRFVINLPLLKPMLQNQVIDRAPGLVVWQFRGFFEGTDRWECDPMDEGTLLKNSFSFEIPNPLVRFGFDRFAQDLTIADMQTQLKRIKVLAETLESKSRQAGFHPDRSPLQGPLQNNIEKYKYLYDGAGTGNSSVH